VGIGVRAHPTVPESGITFASPIHRRDGGGGTHTRSGFSSGTTVRGASTIRRLASTRLFNAWRRISGGYGRFQSGWYDRRTRCVYDISSAQLAARNFARVAVLLLRELTIAFMPYRQLPLMLRCRNPVGLDVDQSAHRGPAARSRRNATSATTGARGCAVTRVRIASPTLVRLPRPLSPAR